MGDLRDLARRFALVGGLAVSARTEPRLTRDADLVVLVTGDRDAEALVHDLQGRGWRVTTAIEQDVAGRLATVRLALAGADVRGAVVDLLFASSGIEPEIVGEARDSLALVTRRGFHRGRDLLGALDTAVNEFRG